MQVDEGDSSQESDQDESEAPGSSGDHHSQAGFAQYVGESDLGSDDDSEEMGEEDDEELTDSSESDAEGEGNSGSEAEAEQPDRADLERIRNGKSPGVRGADVVHSSI